MKDGGILELTTIVGLIVAVTGLLGGMYFKGVPFSALGNPAAIFIILVGTTGAVLNAFPMADAKNVGKLFGIIFTSRKSLNNAETIKQIVDFSQLARKEGLLVLEDKINDLDNPFFKKGLELLLAGQNRDFIEETLSEDIAAMEERHSGNAGIFTQAGTYAPTLGVLGAVIGLIAALGNMADQEKLGHAISAAFMATVYGIFTGYVLWHPFANKLKRKSKAEVLNRTIILQGLLLLEQGLSPKLVQENLISYLPPADRLQFDESNSKGGENNG